MKYYIIKMVTGFAGMDAHDVLEMSDGATEDEIADQAYEMALSNAEMYGIYPVNEYAQYVEEGLEDIDIASLSDYIEGYSLGEYVPALHDGKRSCGGSFQDDIDRMR